MYIRLCVYIYIYRLSSMSFVWDWLVIVLPAEPSIACPMVAEFVPLHDKLGLCLPDESDLIIANIVLETRLTKSKGPTATPTGDLQFSRYAGFG